MSKNRDEEKNVDAVVVEDDAGNEEDQVQEGKEDQIRETSKGDEVLTTENDQAPERTSRQKKKDKVMAAGEDVPTVAGPSVVMVNRAAIVYLAKHLMAPPDLEDFKTAFPSLF